MSYKFSFSDNEVYSSSDVNEITKRLVTSGIEDSFSDGVAYNVSRFNDAGKLLYTSGVVPESCLTLKVTKESDDKILINPGLAFFNDGATIEIEAGGETLSYVSGAKNYVYLKNDLINTNRCFPCCTTQAPEGDYVLLAEIDDSGSIEDKRTYAKGRLPGYQSVAGNVMRITDNVKMANFIFDSTYSGSKTFDIGNNTYQYILCYVKKANYTFECLGIYDIAEQSYLGFSRIDTYQLSSIAFINELPCLYHNQRNNAKLTFALDNGKLTVTLTAINAPKDLIGTVYDIDLILF